MRSVLESQHHPIPVKPPGLLGLLAGREIAVRIRLKLSDRQPLYKVLGSDLFKAGVGIVVSLIVALAIQPLKALG